MEKAKLIYRTLENWVQKMSAKRFKALFISLWAIVILLLILCLVIANKPSYEPGGLETNGDLINLKYDYAYLHSSYEALTLDYDNIKNTLISTIAKLETSDQTANAYLNAYNELLVSYQALSVAKQLLEAGNKDLSQTSDVSKEFSAQYDALVILHKEKSAQYNDLVERIGEVSDKDFFTITDNFTQVDMDSFYIGWDAWVETLEE